MKTHHAFATGVVASLVIAGLAAPAAVADTSMRQIDEDTVLITDFHGKPPYQRRYVQVDDLSVVQFARFEEMNPAADHSRIGDKITVVEHRGRPPFKRTIVEIDESNVTEFGRD
jgi:hypothetical protein